MQDISEEGKQKTISRLLQQKAVVENQNSYGDLEGKFTESSGFYCRGQSLYKCYTSQNYTN